MKNEDKNIERLQRFRQEAELVSNKKNKNLRKLTPSQIEKIKAYGKTSQK